jgi:hypothetical protein
MIPSMPDVFNHAMKGAIRILLSISMATPAFPAWPQSSLPAGTRWLDHLGNELLPFWTTDSTFGNPFGAFPGTRCDDATLYDERNPCPEIRRNTWIRRSSDTWLRFPAKSTAMA